MMALRDFVDHREAGILRRLRLKLRPKHPKCMKVNVEHGKRSRLSSFSSMKYKWIYTPMVE